MSLNFYSTTSLNGNFAGTSVLLVQPDGSYERVTGTCYGGATHWALQQLLTGCASHEQLQACFVIHDTMREAARSPLQALLCEGNSNKVDLLVGDIYGEATEELGLPADLLAATLAKAASHPQDAKPADVAASLSMLTNWTLGQLGAMVNSFSARLLLTLW